MSDDSIQALLWERIQHTVRNIVYTYNAPAETKMTERKVTPEEEYGKDGDKKLGGDSEVPGDEEGAPHTQEQDVGTGPVDKTSDSPPAPTTR